MNNLKILNILEPLLKVETQKLERLKELAATDLDDFIETKLKEYIKSSYRESILSDCVSELKDGASLSELIEEVTTSQFENKYLEDCSLLYSLTIIMIVNAINEVRELLISLK